MNIYQYFFFSYGLTAAIGLLLVVLIVVLNKGMNLFSRKNNQ